MSQSRRELGALGERLAKDYLEKHGYYIRETNFRCPLGEIDIVAEHGDQLVFVEVRTRRSQKFGTPEESITPAKGKRLIDLATTYIQAHEDQPLSWRIDVVVVEIGPGQAVSRLELIQNAIS